MTKIQKLQKRIAVAVARARALGARLVVRNAYGVDYSPRTGWTLYDDEKEVCICGAILLAENPTNGGGILKAIAKKYHITENQAASLSDGFEDNHWSWQQQAKKLDQAWYRIGRKWRERADAIRPSVVS